MLLAGETIACPVVGTAQFSIRKGTKHNGAQKLAPRVVSTTTSSSTRVSQRLTFIVRGSERERPHKASSSLVVASASSAWAPTSPAERPNSDELSPPPATILEAWERFKDAGEDDELPSQYVEREQDRPKLRYDEYSNEGATIPVLDLSLVESDRAASVKSLADACTEWGFFHLINHGIPREILDELEAQTFRFFHLPTHRKKASGKSATGDIYTGDATFEQKSSLQWAESLRFQGPAFQGLDEWSSRIWPDGDRAFREVVRKYSAKVEDIFKTLLELLAEGLGLKTDYFTQYVTENRVTGVVWNFYPPCPQPDKILGARPHTDGCSMTILSTSEVGGLQLQKDGDWVAVRPISGALVVNMGDALQAWTNGTYKSVLHRVVANAGARRMSLASFLNVDSDHLISAPDELVDDEHPRLYRPYKFLDYAKHVLNTRAKDPYAERDGRVVLEGFRLGAEKEGGSERF